MGNHAIFLLKRWEDFLWLICKLSTLSPSKLQKTILQILQGREELSRNDIQRAFDSERPGAREEELFNTCNTGKTGNDV